MGVTGVCPDCTVLLVSIGNDNTLVEALQYARERGADLIVMAFSSGLPRDDVWDALTEIGERIPLFAAAGNEGPAAVDFPASHPSVLAVGGSDCRDAMFGKQHYGDHALAVVAPTRQKPAADGDTCGLNTLDWESYRPRFGGTSGSVALVAGIAGLLLSREPGLTPERVYGLLTQSADRIDCSGGAYDDSGYSEACGYGRVNAGEAMRLLTGPPPE